jgi:hypothetical protein
MKSYNLRYFLISLTIFFGLSTINSFTQSISLGTDLVNRYIWRGLNAGGGSPSVQPNASLMAGGFTIGFWGAYPLEPNLLEEIDLYASYAFVLEESGSLSLGFTDYIFPNSGTRIFNFHNYNDPNGPGAHFLEINAGYSGPENLPVYLSFNVFVYNLKNNPIYFQVGYNTNIEDVDLNLFVGGTPGEDTGYYGVTKFNIINTGFTVSKSIKITESFSLPIFGSLIANPASGNLYYVFGIKL